MTSSQISQLITTLKGPDIVGLVRFLDRANDMAFDPGAFPVPSVVKCHRELHDRFGDRPEDLVLEMERELSNHLRKRGVEHRYSDKLAVAAGTVVKDQRELTLNEVDMYLDDIGLPGGPAIQIAKAVDGPKDAVYISVVSPLLQPVATGLIKAITRSMPKGVQVLPINKAPKGSFIQVIPAYFLKLHRNEQDVGSYDQLVTTWDELNKEFRESAANASPVFKSGVDPQIPFHIILKSTDEEHIVTGVVLEPNVVDSSADQKMGTEGDIYSEDVIRKAMYWWMENAAQNLTLFHVEHGGIPLSHDDVCLLENWQTRVDQKIGDQDIPEGTWMSTQRIRNDSVWKTIKAGKLQSYSIGAQALGKVEQVAA